MDSGEVAAQLHQRGRAVSGAAAPQAVAGTFTMTGGLAAASGRRLPFYWWRGTDAPGIRYAMKPAAGADWTADEVSATVDDYLVMLAAEAAGQQFSKTEHRRAPQRRLSASRTKGAIEYKHQNISAVMIALGLPYIRGLQTHGQLPGGAVRRVGRRLEADPVTGPAEERAVRRCPQRAAAADRPAQTRGREPGAGSGRQQAATSQKGPAVQLRA